MIVGKVKDAFRVFSLITSKAGDLDAFTQLFLNNVGTTLAVTGLLIAVGFDPRYNSSAQYQAEFSQLFEDNPSLVSGMKASLAKYVFRNTVVGLAMSIFFGSLYFTWMGLRVMAKKIKLAENMERDLTTSLPFGVNTPVAFAFVGGILFPVAKSGFDSCMINFQRLPAAESIAGLEQCITDAIHQSWATGVLCNFACGLLSTLLCFFGRLIIRYTPKVALLSSLATIAFAFLLLAEITFSFANPISGILPFFLMLLGYFCEIKFWKLPISITLVCVGAALAWATGVATPAALEKSLSVVGWQGIPVALDCIFAKSAWANVPTYLGVIIPFAVQAAVENLLNVISAAEAGDSYPIQEAMAVNGLCSVLGSFFGTPIMVCVYMGHPGYKTMGATTSYTLYNAFSFLVFALFGLFAFINGLFPSASIGPVIAFVGLIICSEAMSDLPQRHNIVFLLALVPGICDWAGQNGLATNAPEMWGYVAMGGSGAMLFSMVFAAIVAYACDRNFQRAGVWSFVAAILSLFGLLHQDSASTNWDTPHGTYCVARTAPHSDLVAAFALASSNQTVRTCGVGYVPCDSGVGGTFSCGYQATTQVRFMAGYLMASAFFLLLWLLQRRDIVKARVVEDSKPKDYEAKSDLKSSTTDSVMPHRSPNASDSKQQASDGPEQNRDFIELV